MTEANQPDKQPRQFHILRRLLLTVIILLLLVLVLLGSITALLSTERGSQWVLSIASDFVESEGLQLAYGDVSGSFARGLTLHDLDVRMGNNRIAAREFHSQWNPFTLLAGEFVLDRLAITGLLVDWPGNDEVDPEPAEPTSLADTLDGILPLPVSIRLAELSLQDADMISGETELHIESLTLSALLRNRTLNIDALSFQADPISLNGDIALTLADDLALDGAIQWQLSGTLPADLGDQASGRLIVGGDLNRLMLEHWLEAPLDLHSRGELTLGLADMLNTVSDAMDMAIDFEHEIPQQDLPFAALDPWATGPTRLQTRGWLDSMQISGSSNLRSVAMDGLNLDSALEWQLELRGSQLIINTADISTDSGEVNASGTVDWTDTVMIALDLQLQDNSPLGYIEQAPEAVALSDLVAALTVNLRLEEAGPQGEVNLQSFSAVLNDFPMDANGSLSLDGNDITVEALELLAANNEIRLSGSLREDTLDLILALSAPELGQLHPDLAGRLQLDATVGGRMNDLQISIDGSAEELSFNDIRIATITINGNTRDNNNQLNLTVRDLVAAEQRIDSIDLQLDGQPDDHVLDLDVDSELLQLSLALQGGLEDEGWAGSLLDSRFSAPEFALGEWQQVDSSSLQLSADRNNLSNTCWRQAEASICLDAALDETQNLVASLTLNGYPLAALNSDVAASIVNNFHDTDGHYQAADDVISLPITLPDNMALLGQFRAEANASGPINDLNALQLDFATHIDNLELYVLAQAVEENNGEAIDPVVEQFLWEQAEITGELSEGHWRVNSNMAFYQQSISGTAVAMRGSTEAQLHMDPEQALDGRLQLDFDDMAWLEALVPQVSDVQGQFGGALLISGTLGEPVIGTDFALQEASFGIAALGLDLQAVNLSLSSDESGDFRLEASAQSGEGQLNIESDILRPMEDSREFTLTLQGEDFLLADIEEVTLGISPDLRVQGSASGIHATGNLLIPLLDARIEALPETATNVSSDAILLNQREDRPAVRNAAQIDQGPLSDIPISAEVRIVLGDDVRFSAFGLNARLQGMLDINQRPQGAPLMYGELDVAEGSFETYGTLLDIEQGQLLFFGPFDNPAIDIRAVRTVENMRVGVQMNGTIRNMRSQLFSNPTLPDGDILAVLITGRPLAEIGSGSQDGNAMVGAITSLGISQSEGLTDQVRSQLGLDTLAIDSSGDVHDSSLTLGKYITPRIFIKYAVGLFETESSLAIDYSVTDNIKLEAKSGQNQSLDLTYTIER